LNLRNGLALLLQRRLDFLGLCKDSLITHEILQRIRSCEYGTSFIKLLMAKY
jgi:hypothetical protein